MKKVSVAMASYNGELFIKEQIESILMCLDSSDELIISDDGSSDETIDIINSKINTDHRIKLIRGNQKNIVKNFENAINHCNGDYIFLSDQDDIWYNNKVEKVLETFNKTNADIILHNANILDNKNSKIINTTKDIFGFRNSYFKNVIKNSFIGCCMAIKKDILDIVLPFPESDKIYMHDWWIGLCTLKSGGKVEYIDEPMMLYRIHDNNSIGLKKNDLIKKLVIRKNLILAINKRMKSKKITVNNLES